MPSDAGKAADALEPPGLPFHRFPVHRVSLPCFFALCERLRHRSPHQWWAVNGAEEPLAVRAYKICCISAILPLRTAIERERVRRLSGITGGSADIRLVGINSYPRHPAAWSSRDEVETYVRQRVHLSCTPAAVSALHSGSGP